jgi:DNA-binding Lrp family transcriptional regulator
LEIKHNLSSIDRMMLKEILSQEEKKTSEVLSKKSGIPLTTVQRRRKLLEKELLKKEYLFRLDKFGWRREDFIISTRNGKTDEVANDVLTMEPIIFVGKSIGQHTIDLRVESIVKDK